MDQSAELRDMLAGSGPWLQGIHGALQDLGIDADQVLEISAEQLSSANARRLQQCADYLITAPHIRQLRTLLGQLRLLNASHEWDIRRRARRIHGSLPDIHSRHEVPVLSTGQRLEQLLPSEIRALADPELELLFDLRFAEGQLVGFYGDVENIDGTPVPCIFEENSNAANVRGPLIVCMDTSETMQGLPETLAKALSLIMVNRAGEQGRPVYLVNCSATVDVMDLSAGLDLMSLLDFLSWSCESHCDVVPAISHAMQTLNDAAIGPADMVILSGLLMAKLPRSISNIMQSCRRKGHRFFAVSVGDLFLETRSPAIFDGEWVFHPQRSSLLELTRITSQVFE